jgi:hypothetical protein
VPHSLDISPILQFPFATQQRKVKRHKWKNDSLLNGAYFPDTEFGSDVVHFNVDLQEEDVVGLAMLLEFSFTFKFEEHRASKN